MMKTELKGVLIVDDERDMCWALDHIFKRAGYAATSVCTGHDALERLANGDFPLVILDAKLPDMEGLDLAIEIRRASPSTRILIVSGYYYHDDLDIQQALKDGVISGFIGKPFIHETILDQVDRTMSKTSPQPQRELSLLP
jgi:DNA-binding NtrC family response regulator